jgi:GntR family transcriptional regulator/MocR family aminotransferase
LALAKQVADRGSPGLDQLALAKMLESGRYDRHLRRMRTEYAKRREVLVAALALHAPGVAITGLAAGFHAVVTLPADAQENRIIEKAARRGVGLYGMSSMRHSAGPHQSQLILGFGDTSQSAIQAGIAAVGDLLCGTPE